MKDMKNIQKERRQIRQQLDEAYRRHNRDEVIKAARQLSELDAKIMKN